MMDADTTNRYGSMLASWGGWICEKMEWGLLVYFILFFVRRIKMEGGNFQFLTYLHLLIE